jgi:hyperosmotically inducible periplasmic protein
MWNKDEIQGKHNEIEGAVNAKVGKFIHDPNLEAEGKAERLAGQAQQKVGKLRRKAAEAAKQADKVSTWFGVTGLLTLTLLGSSLALNGCATTGSREATSSPTPQAQISNVALEEKIKAKFRTDVQLKAAKLGVEANVARNEITLSGVVESEELRTKAVEWAKSAHPGLIVNAKLDVKPGEIARAEYTSERAQLERSRAKEVGETVGDSLDDAWIHTKIVAQLIGNSATPERKINVDVDNHVVTLRGLVETAAQKTEAGRVAQNTEGVKSVSNQLKVGGAPVKKS